MHGECSIPSCAVATAGHLAGGRVPDRIRMRGSVWRIVAVAGRVVLGSRQETRLCRTR
ncbi:MAG: hypothetical protein NVSMB65_19780 [Chloroflexota bacterium]